MAPKRKLNETDEPSVVAEPQTQKKTKKASTEKKEKKEKKSKSQNVKPQEEEKHEETQQQEQQEQAEEEQQLEQQLKDEQKQQDEKDEKKNKSQEDQKKENQNDDADLTFSDLGLDPRLVQAVAKQSFEKPTLVQRKAIPLALAGQDVLCKANTGSGKTAAYVLPVLSGILKRKAVSLSYHLGEWNGL